MNNDTREIPLSHLRIAQANTRKDIGAGQEDSDLEGLARSMDENGLLAPIVVRPLGDGDFEIIAGQRRFKAARQLGWASIRATVREAVSDTSAVTLSLIENVQRADMHPIDKAKAYQELRERYNGDLREVEKVTGVGLQTIRKYLELLKLAPDLQARVGTGHGSAGVGAMSEIARTFSKGDEQVAAYNQIGGFNQGVQREILMRSRGDLDAIPELVEQAQEGAFDTKRCGSGIHDCPFIPDELRAAVASSVRALSAREADPARSLREFSASHKIRPG